MCVCVCCSGFVPTENLRFREENLTFKVVEQDTKEDEVKKFLRYQYPAMKKTQVSTHCVLHAHNPASWSSRPRRSWSKLASYV